MDEHHEIFTNIMALGKRGVMFISPILLANSFIGRIADGTLQALYEACYGSGDRD